MNGFLDEFDRPRCTVDLGQGPLDAVIDTAFSGTLLIGEEIFDSAGAAEAGTAEADLAAHQSYVFNAFDVILNWFGQQVQTRVLVGPGKECLLGTALLAPHRLEIDFEKRTVRLDKGSSW
jgi:clan AA aspartic protease